MRGPAAQAAGPPMADPQAADDGRRALAAARPLVLEVRGLALAGLAFGPPSGRPLLALHGWLDNAHSFAPLAAHLPDCHLVALEAPGHGHSAHHALDAEYHIMDYVHDVHGALEALGWSSASLVGHSMGACVMTLVAGALPERTQELVLLDGVAPLSCPPEELPARLRRHIHEQGRLARRRPRRYASCDAFAAQLARVVPNLSPSAARLLAARGCTEVDGGAFVQRADPRLRGTQGPRLDEAQALAFLRQIVAPTLLVRATDGFPIDADQLAARTAAVARLEVACVAGGHHVHMDHPGAVAAAVRAFWSRPPPPPRG